jgi:methyltransferase-like protein
VKYRSPSGLVMSTTRPLLKATMQVLAEAWPGTLSFPELLTRSRAAAGLTDPASLDSDARNLAGGLVDSYLGSDMVELHGAPITLTPVASEKPRALPSARLRAQEGRPVANRRHELVRLGDLERCLLAALDGTRDRAALVEECVAAVATGRLHLERDGREVRDPDVVKTTLTNIIDQPLNVLAKQALLIA